MPPIIDNMKLNSTNVFLRFDFLWKYYTYRLYDIGFINWHNLVNKKSNMVNFVSVILPEKIKSQKKI